MLKHELLNKIRGQAAQLELEMNALIKKRKEKSERSCFGMFTQHLSAFFHDEVQIKHAKINALKKLDTVVQQGQSSGLSDLYIRCSEKKNLTFSGINNRTEKLFDEAARFLALDKKAQATQHRYKPNL